MLWVALRSFNDAWIIRRTLEALKTQSVEHKLLILDNASSDGTAEIGREYADLFVNVPSGSYVPGKVLNQAMELTEGDFVVFLNSDCPPQDAHCLERLIRPFDDVQVAATFGCQMPHADCYPIFARDTDDTFGDGSRQKYWKHCFSMAISAVRRSDWEARPFREDIQYSEDIEFTWAQVQRGQKVAYAADARVLHSHNYSIAQYAKRQAGEGKAEAAFFEWSRWQTTFWRYTLLPTLRQIAKDWIYCAKRKQWAWLLWAPAYRIRGAIARRRAFLAGLVGEE
jgi:rhamnosyltransferase